MAAICLFPGSSRSSDGEQDDTGSVVLAIVNGDTITSAALDRLLISTHRSMVQMDREDFDYEKLLTRLVRDRLLIQEAIAIGMHEDSDLATELDSRRKKQAAILWARDHFKPDLEISNEEIREYFAINFVRVQLRVLVTQTGPEAQAAFEAIRAGAAMDSLAGEISIDVHRTNGGLHKPAHFGELEPSLRAVTMTLDVNEMSEPIPYRSVFAVVRLEQRFPVDTSEFESMRPRIQSWLKRARNTEQWDAFVAAQKTSLGLTVDEAVMDRIRVDSTGLFTQTFQEGSDAVVVRAGSDAAITENEFRKEFAHMAMSAGTTPFEELRQQCLDQIAERLALTAAAFNDGYHELPVVIDTWERSMDSALVETYLKETVAPKIAFNREEFEEYYNEHRDAYIRPDRVQFDRMVVDSAVIAEEIYARLKNGADFRYIAKQFNVELGSAEENSEWVQLSTFPEDMQQEIRERGVGGYITPRQSAEGWLILRLRVLKTGEQMLQAEVEPLIQEAMFQEKFNEELDKIISTLVENSDIYYDRSAIRDYFKGEK